VTGRRAKCRLLVLDDEPGVVEYLVEMLREAGYEAQGVSSPSAALELVRREPLDLLVTDVEMPEMRGIDLLATIVRERPGLLVLLITAFGSIDLAVQAMRFGACDFIAKPFTIEVLLLAIERALRERRMRREIVRLRSRLAGEAPGEPVARSEAMRRVLELARRAARSDAPVLLTGESGSGKGLCARFLHDHGPRREGPFLQVNCAALPELLVESELFGVRRGAFTDAREDRDGLFVQASGGTLFLDEIAEMPLGAQAKLLQVLEGGRVRPIGADREKAVDVRVLAATNRSPEEQLRERRFRADLYYRLNVLRLDLPPLRERPEDLMELVDVFLARASRRHGAPLVGISAEAMRKLLAHDWPGNVRELANVVERAVVLTKHDTILPEDLPLPDPGSARAGSIREAASRGLSLAELERAYVVEVLEASGWNKTRAARSLGIDRRTLYRKLAEDSDPAAFR